MAECLDHFYLISLNILTRSETNIIIGSYEIGRDAGERNNAVPSMVPWGHSSVGRAVD